MLTEMVLTEQQPLTASGLQTRWRATKPREDWEG
jgi:hypothetical protein